MKIQDMPLAKKAARRVRQKRRLSKTFNLTEGGRDEFPKTNV